MKTKEIRDLIEFIASTGLNEVNIETEELKISVKREPDVNTKIVESSSVVPSVATSAVPPTSTSSEPSGTTTEGPSAGTGKFVEIKSPMIGTFYRASSPDKPPFVSVGDEIKKGDILWIIEAMKLFNEIEAEVSGKIIKVLAADSTPVEYEQPLFLIEPH